MVSLNKYAMIIASMATLFSGIVKADEVNTDDKKSELTEKFQELKATFNNSSVKKFFDEIRSPENVNWLVDCKNMIVDKAKNIFTHYPMHMAGASFLGSGWFASRLANKEHLSKEELIKCLKHRGHRNFWIGSALLVGHAVSNYEFNFAKKVNPQVTERKVVIEELKLNQ
jgi:hypothetical protein